MHWRNVIRVRKNDSTAKKFLIRWHKQNLYYFLWERAYKAARECYGIWRCRPLDAAMHRRFALFAYVGNSYAFKDVYDYWRDDDE